MARLPRELCLYCARLAVEQLQRSTGTPSQCYNILLTCRLFYRSAVTLAWSTFDTSFMSSLSLCRLLTQLKRDPDVIPLHQIRSLRVRSRSFPSAANLEASDATKPESFLARCLEHPERLKGRYGLPAILVPMAWELLAPCVNVRTLAIDCQAPLFIYMGALVWHTDAYLRKLLVESREAGEQSLHSRDYCSSVIAFADVFPSVHHLSVDLTTMPEVNWDRALRLDRFKHLVSLNVSGSRSLSWTCLFRILSSCSHLTSLMLCRYSLPALESLSLPDSFTSPLTHLGFRQPKNGETLPTDFLILFLIRFRTTLTSLDLPTEQAAVTSTYTALLASLGPHDEYEPAAALTDLSIARDTTWSSWATSETDDDDYFASLFSLVPSSSSSPAPGTPAVLSVRDLLWKMGVCERGLKEVCWAIEGLKEVRVAEVELKSRWLEEMRKGKGRVEAWEAILASSCA